MAAPIEIPKRAFFKSAEVCAIAGVQPYVLKSWESEFPSLGGKKRRDGSRVYGRPEVELVLEIKELVYGEGLTLGAARRKLDSGDRDQTEPEAEAIVEDALSDDARATLDGVKRGLREILALLSGNGKGAVQKPLQLGTAPPEEAPAAATTSAQSKERKAAGATRARAGVAAKRKAAAKHKRQTA